MTVVVAFLCSNGVVVAADSMLTPTVGNINVGHHHGRKVHVLSGPQVFSFAGDQGQASRFHVMAELSHAMITQQGHPLDYPLALTKGIVNQFNSTGLSSFGVNTILGFVHNDKAHCCVFDGNLLQPRLLDEHHYYVALGSGKLSADPFLRFLVDIFCRSGQPNVREAIFLATWSVQHVIDTNPGGVAGPIRIAVMEKDHGGSFVARDLPDTDMEESKQAIDSAAEALLTWRKNIQSGQAAEGIPPLPEPPPAPA